jgi:hypothetical protein
MFTLPSKPQGIGQVLDAGFQLFTATFTKTIGLALVGTLVSTLPGTLLQHRIASVHDPIAALRVMLPVLLGTSVISLWLYNAIIFRMGMLARGEPAALSEALSVGLRRVIPVLLAGILGGLAIIGGLVLLIVPGLMLMVSLIFFSYDIILDGGGILSSLKRSHHYAVLLVQYHDLMLRKEGGDLESRLAQATA